MSLWSRIRNVVRPGSYESEIREELEFHIAMDRFRGHDARDARLRLGNPVRIREEVREMRIAATFESVFEDVRYGVRQMHRNPALSFAIVLSLAVGLGANAAIFKLVDAAILKPLPVEAPERLVLLEWNMEGQPAFAQRIGGAPRTVEGGRNQIPTVSEAVHRRFAAEQSAFADVIGFSSLLRMGLNDGTRVDEAGVQYVSTNFFAALGVRPVLGRPFVEEDDVRGEEARLILSHRYWSGRLGGDPDVIGRTVRVNNSRARIVGVAPPGFFGLAIGEWVDAYAPLSARPAFESATAVRPPSGGENAVWWVRQAARLRPGTDSAASAVASTPLFRTLAAETTGTEPETSLQLAAESGQRGFAPIAERETRALRILMLLVAALLLIVSANVANLLLSRSVNQQRESSVRLALGAPRHRVLRQHLVSSSVLAVLGGIGGVGIGYWCARAIHALFATGQGASNAFDLRMDWRLVAYTAALAGTAALVFGLAPAIAASRSDLNGGLRAQARALVGGRLRFGKLLVSFQLALTFTAVVAAGLLGRSLGNLHGVHLGFDPENLSYVTVNPYQAGYTQDRVTDYVDRVDAALRAIPGVVDVAVVDSRPLQGGARGTWAATPDGPPPQLDDGRPNPDAFVSLSLGGAEMMDTLGVRMLAGRRLGANDGRGDPVAAVDERFAEVFFAGRDPVGERFTLFGDSIEVVGLAANARFLDIRDNAAPTVYLPYDPTQFLPEEMHFAVRASVPLDGLADDLRAAVARVDAAVPITELQTQAGLINRSLRVERLLAFLSGGFGAIALTLAAIGLGGLLAYAVARRTGEIGVRLALGAAPGDVIRMVLGDSVAILGLGMLVGAPIAYAVARILEASLFGLEAIDPVSALFAVCVLLLVALTAALVPARRAARVDPVVALRDE